MNNIIPPTTQDWREELIESVLHELDDSSRHGNYVYEVFHRATDDTYWAVNYSVSGDGEAVMFVVTQAMLFTRVYPHKKVVTVVEYLTKPQI